MTQTNPQVLAAMESVQKPSGELQYIKLLDKNRENLQ